MAFTNERCAPARTYWGAYFSGDFGCSNPGTRRARCPLSIRIEYTAVNAYLKKDSVTWAIPLEYGFTMFSIVNVYTKAAQYKALPAESSFRLEKVGGTILGMVKHTVN